MSTSNNSNTDLTNYNEFVKAWRDYEKQGAATDNSGAIAGGIWDSTPPIGTGLGGIRSYPLTAPNVGDFHNIEPSGIFKNLIDYTDDNQEILFSDGFKVTAKELKICLKMMLKMAKEEYPEEFI